MNTYERIFGAGPRGLAISCLLLLGAYRLEGVLGLPAISHNPAANAAVFAVMIIVTVSVTVWSVRSLPPSERGKALCTSGAFAWFRHPLYAAFLTFFNFGLAVFLNNWIYVIWAVAQHPVWHLNIRYEERLVREEFGLEYDEYARRTGRFFPRLRLH